LEPLVRHSHNILEVLTFFFAILLLLLLAYLVCLAKHV
jgi:hypothetical protein